MAQNSSSQRKLWPTFGWVLVGVVFLIVSSLAVAWANGLVFDPARRSFQRSVIVSVEASLKEVEIFLNDKLVASEAPISFRGLRAGRHQIRIEKDGYHSWQESWQLEYGQVGLIAGSVRLIAKEPTVESSIGQLGPSVTYDLGLEVGKTGELLDSGRFVTSFAVAPIGAHRFYDGYIYQIGSEIRLAWPKAALDFPIFGLAETGQLSPAPLVVDESNWLIRLQAADRVVTVHLLIPNELPVRTPAEVVN